MTVPVTSPGTITIYSDIWCSFAHVAIYRLHRERARLGLEGVVQFDLHAFPLELLNDAPSPRPGTDSEVACMARLEPDAGWQLWQAKDWLYPSTTLPALEAVLAAKAESIAASEALDLSLRRAFWEESRCVSNRDVIVDCARAAGIDTDLLVHHLDQGTYRRVLSLDAATSASEHVTCSPHLFLHSGESYANPGVVAKWNGGYGIGYPVVLEDNPAIYEQILTSAGAVVTETAV